MPCRINDVLGRLDCATEPRLLYVKAMYHAYTSFVVSDPLTGRTGSEEALHCLESGYCQPWSPLNFWSLQDLNLISQLTPCREYYPKDLKVMQKTTCKCPGYPDPLFPFLSCNFRIYFINSIAMSLQLLTFLK